MSRSALAHFSVPEPTSWTMSWPDWVAISAAILAGICRCGTWSMVTFTLFLVLHCSAKASYHLSYEGTKCVQARTRTSFVCWAHAGRLHTWGNAPRAAAPPAAVPRNLRRVMRFMMPILLGWCGVSLQGTCGESVNEMIEAERVDDSDRDGADEGARHEGAPVEHVTADEITGDAVGDGLVGGGGDEGQRVDVLLVGQGEGEDARGDDAGHDDGQDDHPEGLEPAAPVDLGALLDLARDRAHEAHEEPGAEGQGEGRVHEDERPDGIDEAEPAHELRQGEEEQGGRNQVREEHGGGQRLGQGKAHAGEGVGGGEGEGEGDQHHEGADEHAVLQPLEEERALDEQLH